MQESYFLSKMREKLFFPLYVAYNIYRCRVEEAKKKYGESITKRT